MYLNLTGAGVVQLCVHDPLASVARPILELKGFRKVFLEPGEFLIYVGGSPATSV